MTIIGALVTHTHQDHVGGSLASWGMPGRIPGVEVSLKFRGEAADEAPDIQEPGRQKAKDEEREEPAPRLSPIPGQGRPSGGRPHDRREPVAEGEKRPRGRNDRQTQCFGS